MASDLAVDFAPFDALPEPVLRLILLALPVDARARAACVCRAWLALLSDPSLWHVLDLTPAGGVADERLTDTLVTGAVERCAGQMRVLSLNSTPAPIPLVEGEYLAELLAYHGAELQQLNTVAIVTVEELDSLLDAAPRLQAINAGVAGQCDDLLPILRNEPPYGPLRVSALEIDGFGAAHAATLPALIAAVRAHESLNGLILEDTDPPRAVNSLLVAVVQRSVSWLILNNCSLDAESVSALARLLQRGSLTDLRIMCAGFPHAQEASSPVLCAALQTCRMLTYLEVELNPEGGANRRTVAELLDAAAALPALEYLILDGSVFEDRAAAGHALGALLRADLPNLRTVCVHNCHLGDEGLAPLLDGLAANTHLREVQCNANDVSPAFMRDRLAPALAALAGRAALDA